MGATKKEGAIGSKGVNQGQYQQRQARKAQTIQRWPKSYPWSNAYLKISPQELIKQVLECRIDLEDTQAYVHNLILERQGINSTQVKWKQYREVRNKV